MKLSEYRDNYYDLSSRASAVSRQIAFAGIAIVWIFKEGDVNERTLSLPHELLLPTIFLILSLAGDLLQYMTGAAIWGTYCRYKEVKCGTGTDPEFAVPVWINWPTLFFFWGKVLSVITAYYLLFSFAVGSVSFK
ncbi:MAG: hypothetical protein JXR18_05825 [Neptuniibacter sp.]